ncbi:MAG: YaiI/YqxD family protein [Pseudomonadota bacterium]
MTQDIRIYVDADACPVKEEVYRVAFRLEIPVAVVSNSFIRTPKGKLVSFVLVDATPDAADDYIAEHADEMSVVITADILLAERCLNVGARVLAPNGKPFTLDSIGSAVAMRAIMEDMRGTGESTGGPPPFSAKDRSRFLSALDTAVMALRRAR